MCRFKALERFITKMERTCIGVIRISKTANRDHGDFILVLDPHSFHQSSVFVRLNES